MRRTLSMGVILLLLVTACGRRLPVETPAPISATSPSVASVPTTAPETPVVATIQPTTEAATSVPTGDDTTDAGMVVDEPVVDTTDGGETTSNEPVQTVSQTVALSQDEARRVDAFNSLSDDIIFTLVAQGNVEEGRTLFESAQGDLPACTDCHVADETVPGFQSVATIAGQRVPGYTQERYLYLSITVPNAHLAPGYGFEEDPMPTNYLDVLNAGDVADLVAYMLTLEGDVDEVQPALVISEDGTEVVGLAPSDTETTAVTPADVAQTTDETPAPTDAPVDEPTPEAVETQVVEVVETPAPTEAPAEPAVSDPLQLMVSLGNPANGEALFNQMNDTGFACATCHYVDSTDVGVGPGLLGIPSRAGERVPGTGPYSYIYNSIIHPNDYLVDGFAEGVMPQVYEDVYSDAQLYDIIAYLMTLSQ